MPAETLVATEDLTEDDILWWLGMMKYLARLQGQTLLALLQDLLYHAVGDQMSAADRTIISRAITDIKKHGDDWFAVPTLPSGIAPAVWLP